MACLYKKQANKQTKQNKKQNKKQQKLKHPSGPQSKKAVCAWQINYKLLSFLRQNFGEMSRGSVLFHN